MAMERTSPEESIEKWRHAFVLLASLELGRVPNWQGPDDFEELKLRIETLVLLLALVPRNQMDRLEEVIDYLADFRVADAILDIRAVRTGIRRSMTRSIEPGRNDPRIGKLETGVVANTAIPLGVACNSPNPGDYEEDWNSWHPGIRAWINELKTAPEWSRIMLLGAEFSLEETFVELFTVPEVDVEYGTANESERVRRVAGRISGETHAVIDAETMIARTSNYCIVVGDPGSGKSTLVKWIAQKAADRKIADFEFALVVKLGPFAQALENSPNLPLLDYLFDSLGFEAQDRAGAANWVRRSAEEGARYLLLLDGWDEVPMGLTNIVRGRIDRERPYFTTILTSRPSGFPQRLADGRQTDVYQIAGLTRDGRRTLAERYLRAVGRESALGSLLQEIESSRDLQELACNPFLLALLTWAIDARGVNRKTEWTLAELYGRVVDWMVDSTAEKGADYRVRLAQSLDGLERLSYRLLFDERMPQYVFSENKLIRELNPSSTSAIVRSLFVSQVDVHSSRFAFMHATFEEYFAARHTKALGQQELAKVLEHAFLSASRSIVLEFVVGLSSESGQTCRMSLDRWLQRRDRYGHVVIRITRLLAACPAKLRPPSLLASVRSELWKRITEGRDLDIKRICVAQYARLDPVALCRAVRAEREPDQFVLDCVATSVPAKVGMTERIAELMDPAMRERIEAEIWGEPSSADIEANRRTLIDPDVREDRLRQAILFAGAVRDLGAVPTLELCLRGSKLPDELQREVSTSLGLIGGKEASRVLVEMVIGDIPASPRAVGLARLSLRHIEGHKRLDPAGRDRILRRIACTSVNESKAILAQVRLLAILKGFPIRTGSGLLKYFAFSIHIDESVRRDCLQVLESSLSDRELDGLLKRIEGAGAEMESLLLGMAVQRHRAVPVSWLTDRLEKATNLREKTMLLTVALLMAAQRENPLTDTEMLLAETTRLALLSDGASHADLAGAFNAAFADIPVDPDHSPAWIDLDLCQGLLRSFVRREQDVPAERVMLAATLLGHISSAETGKLLLQCLFSCRDRLTGSPTEMQIKLLMEVARVISLSLAKLDPQALLAFPHDWQPVNEVLQTLSNRRGWFVFDDRILDNEGQRVLAPWQDQEVHFDKDGESPFFAGRRPPSTSELAARQPSDPPLGATHFAAPTSSGSRTLPESREPNFLEQFSEMRSKRNISGLKALAVLFCAFERGRALSLNQASNWLKHEGCPLPKSVSLLSNRILELNQTIQDLWHENRRLFPDFVTAAELPVEVRASGPVGDPEEVGDSTILGLSRFGKWLSGEGIKFLRNHDMQFPNYRSFLLGS